MFRHSWLLIAAALMIGSPIVFDPTTGANGTEPSEQSGYAGDPNGSILKISGKTVPTPGRISEIAATVMHPVERVLVKPGDFVRAGQPLVELDADEPKAEVRARQAQVKELSAALAKLRAMPRREERAQAKAELESAQVTTQASRAYLARLESLRKHDAVSVRDYIQQETEVRRAEADERAAQAHLEYLLKFPIEQELAEAEQQLAVAEAELEAAEYELEHYTICAAIDGIVCRLDVTPGSVVRAGTKVWGEIVDLREVDVLVELTPRQLRNIDTTRPIRIEQADLERTWTAKFIYAGPIANSETGLVPVILRVAEAGEPLRCHLTVTASIPCGASEVGARTQNPLALEGLPIK